ncbi:MAG: hypothetical protein ACREXX_22335 [Gammaproteobacteria bacterium]
MPVPLTAFLTPDERFKHALTPDGRARPCRAAEPPSEIVQANLPPPTVPRDCGVLPQAATQFERLGRGSGQDP